MHTHGIYDKRKKCLPPCGGSGLKLCACAPILDTQVLSPSMRREWIEMPWTYWNGNYAVCLPPCGGSGLKYVLNRQDTILAVRVSLHAEGVD